MGGLGVGWVGGGCGNGVTQECLFIQAHACSELKMDQCQCTGPLRLD